MANEHEIAPEELAEPETEAAHEETPVSQPEAEPGEDAEDASQPEPVAPAAGEAESEAGCPIMMGKPVGPRCGRKVHTAPGGVDEQPICLMHSKDPNKQSGPLFDTFWLEFERILKAAGEGEAHFAHFVFPRLILSNRTFHAICRFGSATFTRTVDFNRAIFTKEAEFSHATFTQSVTFRKAIFTQNAYFRKSTFTQNATFRKATFTQRAYFREAIFSQDTNFYSATFTQGADFRETTFTQNTDFRLATFIQAASFVDAEFHRTAYWMRSQFFDRAEFRRTKFLPKNASWPSAVFALARFSKPGEILFDDVDLSRALFHNCDVSQIWFTSSVEWAKREGTRGLAVFDEKYRSKEWSDELDIVVQVQLDYRAVAQIYQQLQKNYDDRLDYRKANDFHYGEMEMRRQASPTSGQLLRRRHWWHRKLSLLAWYRYASDYGNSYAKPGKWLFRILLAATLLFPVTGLEMKQTQPGYSAIASYRSVWNQQDTWSNNRWAEAKLIGKSGITAIDTATFQRNPEYSPVYPWGRILGIIETLLTSSLFALFLLAIRRQFRR